MGPGNGDFTYFDIAFMSPTHCKLLNILKVEYDYRAIEILQNQMLCQL